MALRSAFLILTVSGVLLADPAPNAHSISRVFTVVDIGTLGGTESFAYAVNNRGDVVGTSRAFGDTSTHAFLYRSGSLADLSPLNSGSLQTFGPSDINNVGQVASGVIKNGLYVPAVLDLRSGKISTLGSLGRATAFGFSGVATAINDRGQVVGYSYLDGLNRHAFLYSDGQILDLGSLGGYSGALAINNSGEIAGFASESADGFAHAFVYRNGVMTEIDALGGLNNESYAYGINSRGQVVGEALNGSGNAFNGFLYSDGRATNIGTLAGGLNSSAFSINDRGQVVGVADAPYDDLCFDFETGESVPCVKYSQRAFLYEDGVMLDLNLLVSADSGWDLLWAFDINNRGQIVGYGVHDGKFRAYLATPVPEHRTLTPFVRNQTLGDWLLPKAFPKVTTSFRSLTTFHNPA